MALIDLSNYTSSLYQASADTFLDGNVFFDKAAGTIQFGDATDHATLDLTGHGGGATDANPLIRLDGLKFEAVYAFENQERRTDEDLRKYNRWTSGTFKFGGAYNFVYGRVPADDASRGLIRGSGWNEYNATNTAIIRKYFGVNGLGIIGTSSQPYYQAAQYGAATDFNKTGNINEATLVYRDDNGDGTPDEDNTDTATTNMYMSIRTYGKNYGRIDAAGTLGIAELGGYSTGAALNESDHLTTGSYTLADVYGGGQTAPWDGMTLEKLAGAQTETGFSGADGDFTWVLNNTGGGTLSQCVAYLDAIAQEDGIVTTGTASLNGKQQDVWYEYTPAGKIKPIVGESDPVVLGLFIENLPAGDKTSVEFVDDNDVTCIYPVYTPVTVEIGQGAIDDADAWYHMFLALNYNSGSATEYLEAGDTVVKGIATNASAFITGAETAVSFEHDHTGDGDTNVVFLCEGDGEVTQAKTSFTITAAAVSQSCVPATETNS